MSKGAGQTLRKHLDTAGITSWEDITRASLYDFRDKVTEAVAPSTAKTIMAYAKSLLNRYQDAVSLPSDWRDILSAKGDTIRDTYLTPEELAAFEAVQTRTPRERIVQIEALIEAYTGARISDVVNFTEENYGEGYLTYTSQKTRITATIPVSEKTKGWIRYVQSHRDDEPTLPTREAIIRRLAKLAGIDTKVKIRRAGVEKVVEKWEALHSHNMRKSCATNLASAGVPLTDIKAVLGHTSTAMTERYLCTAVPKLPRGAMAYFGV